MKDSFLKDMPDELKEIFYKLINIFNIDNIESVILVGSASRGELSFYEGKDLFVRSDIEFYVITHKIKKVKKNISVQVKNIELMYNKKWPEFHIDIAYMNREKFLKLEPWIRHYELIQNGKVLVGRNLIKNIPKITVSNLDFNELNEIVLWKMLGLLSRFPIEILESKKTIPMEYGFSLARNILDITTWFLPGKNILIPNYCDRVLFWKNDLDKTSKQFFPFISDSMLEECIVCRRNDNLNLDLDILLTASIKTWLFIYDVIKGNKSIGHLAEGKGFRNTGYLKTLRGLYRNKGMNNLIKYNMLRLGPFNLFTEISVNLLKCIINWENKKEFLENNQSLIGIKDLNLDVAYWDTSRNILMQAVDNYLASNQWSRFIDKKDRL